MYMVTVNWENQNGQLTITNVSTKTTDVLCSDDFQTTTPIPGRPGKGAVDGAILAYIQNIYNTAEVPGGKVAYSPHPLAMVKLPTETCLAYSSYFDQNPVAGAPNSGIGVASQTTTHGTLPPGEFGAPVEGHSGPLPSHQGNGVYNLFLTL